jgi:phage terminase large subunit-like protein
MADQAIAFLETLKIPEGKMAGQPLKLAGFKRQFVCGSLGDGVMVACLSIGRGNAKTALSAGLALGALKGVWDDQPKREILFAARNRDQAKTAFQFLVGFIEGLPEDEQEQFLIRRGSKLEVEYSGNGGGLARCIAADGKSTCILGVDPGGSRSMSAAAFYWPETGRLEALGTFPSNPGLADRGAADSVSGRYVEMAERGELITMGDATVPPGPWLAEIVRQLDGAEVACVVGDRFRHAEFVEAMEKAGLSRVPFIWRGFGWKDGSEDVERFRRALFDGEVKVSPSLLLRSAFSDAIVLHDPANNAKLAKARSLGRIDAAAATLLAVAQGQRMKAAPTRKARVAWA